MHKHASQSLLTAVISTANVKEGRDNDLSLRIIDDS
jgi:hypothetical protein